MIYGDRSQGSPGYTSAYLAAEKQPILVASDPRGDGTYTLLRDRPTLTTIAGPPAEVVLTVPSIAQAGQPFKFHVVVLDRFFNAVTWYTGQLLLNATAPLSFKDCHPRDLKAENGIIQDVPSALLQEQPAGAGELNLLTFRPEDWGIEALHGRICEAGSLQRVRG